MGLIVSAALLLALAVATPAAAQDSKAFPDWLAGVWCGTSQEYKFCLGFTPKADGEIGATYTRQGKDGKIAEQPGGVLKVEDGRLTMRSAEDGTYYREASRTPHALVMQNQIPENIANGDADRITFSLDGDALTVEFAFADGTKHKQVYQRTTLAEGKP